MQRRRSSSPVHLGFLTGAMLIVAADAAHWFLSSWAEVGTARAWLVGAQLVVGVAVSIWAYRRGEVLQAERRRDAGGPAKPVG